VGQVVHDASIYLPRELILKAHVISSKHCSPYSDAELNAPGMLMPASAGAAAVANKHAVSTTRSHEVQLRCRQLCRKFYRHTYFMTLFKQRSN
jgi:hypothetical protein